MKITKEIIKRTLINSTKTFSDPIFLTFFVPFTYMIFKAHDVLESGASSETKGMFVIILVMLYIAMNLYLGLKNG